jgi:hypothetical protein
MNPSQLSYHKYVINNRDTLEQYGGDCGCIHCKKIFNSKEISEWCDSSTTAICPYCGIDAIVSQKSIEFTFDDINRWHSEGFC